MNPDQLHFHNKTLLVTNILKEMSIEHLPVSAENKENIKKYINYLLVKDYLLLDNDNVVLDLSSEATAEPKLSYTETKAIKEYIEVTLERVFKPVINKIKKNEADSYDSHANDLRRKELVEKQKKLQLQEKRLLEITKEKIDLMQKVADIRTGPDQKQLVENLYNEAKLDNLKLE